MSSTWLTMTSTRGRIAEAVSAAAGDAPDVTSAGTRIAAPTTPGRASTTQTVASSAKAADRRPADAGTNPRRRA